MSIIWLIAALAFAVFCLVLGISQITSHGVVVEMDERGFWLHSSLRTNHYVAWDTLAGPAFTVDSSVAREIWLSRRKSLLTFHHRFRIDRQASEFDDRFIAEVAKRLGTKQWS